MLARYYSTKTQAATPTLPTLSDRLLREGAIMCVETTQKVTSLIIETFKPEESIGLLPWWNRIYYLHIAGTTFLAAMFSPDLFTESVSQSWESMMAILRAHEHLSAYVQQCVCTFEALSTKILQTKYPLPDVPLQGEASSSFLGDSVFQDMDFDFDEFLFGAENMI